MLETAALLWREKTLILLIVFLCLLQTLLSGTGSYHSPSHWGLIHREHVTSGCRGGCLGPSTWPLMICTYEGVMSFIPSVLTGQLFSDKSADDGVGRMEVTISFSFILFKLQQTCLCCGLSCNKSYGVWLLSALCQRTFALSWDFVELSDRLIHTE